MANLTVTPEQLAACTRHIDEHGKVFYTVQSASSEGEYTVRWNAAYKVPQDNCAAGRQGNCCWHKKAVLIAERQYQDMKQAERIEASAEYRQEQREQALYVAERNLAQERNATVQCADGSWW